ncbi:DUF4190 domain-containing protein [Streptomyces sp. CC219B]|uniref:DUF4190 domain-containing protein n=1 Tax=Streptomyces sp. CC219B TaxID=3044574 RepID=UPI0024A81B58|nr:DUF4190 domain-containing protein [Streptomyces sp. CC219B]
MEESAKGNGTSGSEGVRSVAGEVERTGRGGNRPAEISAVSAFASVASLGSWIIAPGVFISITLICALTAIVAGHAGRFRGRRLGGEGRWLALAGVVTGWLMLFVCLFAILAFVGLVAAVTVFADS